MLSFKKKGVQLFKFMFRIKEGESRFSVVWYQTVNSVGTIGGIGYFVQQNSSLADQKTIRRRRTPGVGMKARILALNENYKQRGGKA